MASKRSVKKASAKKVTRKKASVRKRVTKKVTPKKRSRSNKRTLKEVASECAPAIALIDSVLSCDGDHKERVNTFLDMYKAAGSDCAYMAHRLVDSLYRHATEAVNDDQARRCVAVEAVSVGEVIDALFSSLNRHGARESYLCDDATLNEHPEWLIRHHHETGGATSIRRIFEEYYLEK